MNYVDLDNILEELDPMAHSRENELEFVPKYILKYKMKVYQHLCFRFTTEFQV